MRHTSSQNWQPVTGGLLPLKKKFVCNLRIVFTVYFFRNHKLINQNAACYDQGRGVAKHRGRDHEGRCHEVRQEPVVQDCFAPPQVRRPVWSCYAFISSFDKIKMILFLFLLTFLAIKNMTIEDEGNFYAFRDHLVFYLTDFMTN